MTRHGKRIFALILAVVMTLSLSVNAFAGKELAPKDGKYVAILHTNDVHGRYVEGKDIIGIPTIAAAKKDMPNALLVDAGDALHGLPFATLSQGSDVVKLMNSAGYDVMVPGNHDFNYGYEQLLNLSKEATFAMLANNVSKDGKTILPATTIKEVDGIKVGFFGVATPETAFKTNPKGIEGITFDDIVTASKASVAELQEQEADVIVAIAHLGVDKSSTDTSYKLAKEVPGIDVIIDGHSHTLFPEGGETVNDVLITSVGSYEQALGYVIITFDKDNKLATKYAHIENAETVTQEVKPDADVAKMVESITADQDKKLNVEVGSVNETLSSAREPGVRTQEMALGNLVADATLDATGADIALLNGGGLRADLKAGTITKKDVVTCLPFGNYIITKYVTPKQLKSLMENGVSKIPGADGRFPQIGGFSFVYDPSMEAGERVTEITVKGKKVDLNDDTTKILLATNDFIAVGGDEYTVLKDIKTENEFPAMEEMLAAYLAKGLGKDAKVEGRIVAKAEAAPADEKKTETPETTKAQTVTEPAPVANASVVFVNDKTVEVTNCYVVNVRQNGSPEEAIIGHLKAGDTATVSGYNAGWVFVAYGDKNGWVYEEYLAVK